MDKRERRQQTLEQQIKRLSRHLKNQRIESERLTRGRLFTFLGGLIAMIAALAIGPQLGVGNMLAIPVVLIAAAFFGWLVYLHRRLNTTIDQFTIWRSIKQTHLARMTLDWAQLPEETITPPHNHPFAVDLDIVGKNSIHHLLDTSVSIGGGKRLADWLLSERPQQQIIEQRQARIHELIPMTNFRDRLTLNASTTARAGGKKWDSETLLRWLQNQEESGISKVALFTLFALSATNIVLFLMYTAGTLPPVWIGTFVIYTILSVIQWRNLGNLFSDAMRLQAQLGRLSAIFGYLETYHYPQNTQIKALCAPFYSGTQRPSGQLRRLSQITAAASLQRNPIVWMFLNLIVPWDIFFGYLLANSKGKLAHILPDWLDVWYELETLSAFATFAHLNPQYTFPVIKPHALLHGKQLGHPLIAVDVKICNDFSLDALGQAVIVTGSNMAGKSSFLRTLGVNLRLAYCGSVVDAGLLEIGLFRVFTCIKVSDSVVDGFSYFYAEVRRLKALLESLRDTNDDMPLFFLIDEIFRGTNNRERLIGSQAYIAALTGENGVGLISTHDLELVKLADTIPEISNYHFREEVIDGKMVFDYTLRPGPSPTTNALKIMAMEGLPIPADASEETQRSKG